jgi:hypothetical protein
MRRVLQITGICVLAVLVLGVVPFVSWCGERPGGGEKATRCYQAANGLMRAVYNYRRQHGSYPASIRDIPRESLKGVHPAPEGRFIEYEARADGEFQVSFEYSGPGMNQCIYSSRSKRWECSGWY